ncbi:CRIB domain-containing protein RIC7 [Spatholobus suberectus]|nr:CRIB domain-containing protein RIC7 [Spatholobus suberectus]
MSGSKVKGLLKGLRYISQIFENEKEQDIQIGYPTDVKHVAHIGWDGPSVNSPSWMNEFKTSPGFASAPINLTGDGQNKGQDNAVKWVSEDTRRRNTRDLPELPKPSKRQSTGGVTDSPTREKSNKPRQSRKSSNKPRDESNPTQQPVSTDSFHPSPTLPDIPKKSRRQRSKENSSGGSSKLRSKAQPTSDAGSPTQSKSRNKPRSFEENETGMDRIS